MNDLILNIFLKFKNRKSTITELFVVITFSIITSLIILRITMFRPGFITVRDTVPIFYSSTLAKENMFSNVQNLIPYMEVAEFPLITLFFINLISYQVFEKLSYLFFPFLVGQISFYYAYTYFTRKYIIKNFEFKNKNIVASIIGLVFAFIYVTIPSSAYFSFWTDMAIFISFAPLIIAGSDYLYSTKVNLTGKLFWMSLLASILLTLGTADPRSLVYSLIIFFAISIYYIVKDKGDRKVTLAKFGLSILFYIMIESRIIYLYFTSTSIYTSISSSIITQQKWALTWFFPIYEAINNTALYWPWVYYNLIGLSFFGLLFASIFIMDNKNKSGIFMYLFFIYLILLMIVSNLLNLGIYLAHIWITYISNYAWIFYPMYLVEMIAPLSILFFAFGTIFLILKISTISKQSNEVITKNFKFHRISVIKFIKFFAVVLLILAVSSQIVFNYPTYASGDYGGMYAPVNPTQAMINAGNLLENASGHTLIIQPPINYGPGWTQNEALEQMLTSYKNAILGTPDELLIPGIPNSLSLTSPMLGRYLLYNGIEYILINNISSDYTSLISTLKFNPSLQLIYSSGGIYIFKNLDFQSKIISSGVYLDFNWPESSTLLYSLNKTLVNIPYYGQAIPISYIKGVIGININLTDIEAILTENYSVNLLNLVGNYAQNPSSLGNSWGYGISDFPIGSTGIGINGVVSQTIYYHVLPGNYTVLVCGQEAPYIDGILLISGVSREAPLIANFQSNLYGTKWVNMGVVTSNGTIEIQNRGSLYITAIRLIPGTEFQIIEKEALNYSKAINIISAEKSPTNAFILNNYTIIRNSFYSGYPYIYIYNGTSQTKNVTFLVYIGQTTFGAGTKLITNTQVLTNYYIYNVYYYVLLGTNYTIQNAQPDNIKIIEINALTVGLIFVIPLYTEVRRKNQNIVK